MEEEGCEIIDSLSCKLSRSPTTLKIQISNFTPIAIDTNYELNHLNKTNYNWCHKKFSLINILRFLYESII